MDKLKKIRIKNKFTLQVMSELLDISKTYYWQIENEKRNLSCALAFKIAKIFNLKPDDIFYYDYLKKN